MAANANSPLPINKVSLSAADTARTKAVTNGPLYVIDGVKVKARDTIMKDPSWTIARVKTDPKS